jgi:hypothetical protein
MSFPGHAGSQSPQFTTGETYLSKVALSRHGGI